MGEDWTNQWSGLRAADSREESLPEPRQESPRRHRREKEDGRPIGRRALIVGGAAAAVGGAVLGWDQLTQDGAMREGMARDMWKIPGMRKPRKEGEVDFAGAQWVAASSANWRMADRPADYSIDMVIIHVTQGSFDSAVKVFQNPSHGAAAHYIFRKDGHVAQMIRELDVAYHAGNRDYNERSIGIEHEGFVERPEDFTDEMYRASARLTARICARHKIPVDRKHILGHVEVPQATHTDPGDGWDWQKYMRMVREARSTQA
ncbi:N-acetylmuramoyl-L-alanine amidase [Streptomyces sp. CA-288835]|uniref:N-acetylmuramoyl-L-alanine amidase n=1 Tax=Streptomyces sp. CA-288835 TaxID=3240069 RepID=UPI003D8C941E